MHYYVASGLSSPKQNPRHVIILVRNCTYVWHRRRCHKHEITLVRFTITGLAAESPALTRVLHALLREHARYTLLDSYANSYSSAPFAGSSRVMRWVPSGTPFVLGKGVLNGYSIS